MSHPNTSIYVSTYYYAYQNIKSLLSIRAHDINSNVISPNAVSIYISCLSKQDLSLLCRDAYGWKCMVKNKTY